LQACHTFPVQVSNVICIKICATIQTNKFTTQHVCFRFVLNDSFMTIKSSHYS